MKWYTICYEFTHSQHLKMWNYNLKNCKRDLRASKIVIFLVFAKFFWSKGEKCNFACAACVCIWIHMAYCIYALYAQRGEGCRRLSLCSRASLTWVSPSWRSVKAVPSAEDSSDRRSDFSGRTEELTRALLEACHLLYASLNTCEYQKSLGMLVRRKTNTCIVSRIHKFTNLAGGERN